jgi:hypothetical protein
MGKKVKCCVQHCRFRNLLKPPFQVFPETAVSGWKKTSSKFGWEKNILEILLGKKHPRSVSGNS